MTKFSTKQLHPVSSLVFFCQTLVVCFAAKSAGLAIIFTFLFIKALYEKKAKFLLWSLPLAGFMFVLNPVFYHGGEHILFTISGFNFTLEAVENGVYCALLILCTMLLFTVLGQEMSEEKFLYVFGRAFPKLALMISMIFKHTELLKNAYEQTKNMAKMNGIYDHDRSLIEKLKTGAVIFEAFTGAALEGSIDTALSLSAKGYYSKKKTVIHRFRFQAWDAVFLAISSVIFVFCFLKTPVNLIATGCLFLLPLIFSERRHDR